jgi:type I restriction-modification system DNA methylase subunit
LLGNFNIKAVYEFPTNFYFLSPPIFFNNTVTAVIELKGTGTTDLGKVESQAFNYKNNQHQCVYVITSNFEKLRFYIDNAIEHIEFNLFKLTEEEFQLLYLCLAFKNIEKNVPKNIKDESVSQEDVITKKLYNDYSLFKRELHHNLVALNPGNDPLQLFQKSQKLLDRFLFIFFAEDRGLLPTNLIFRINKEWQQLREMRIEVSLYDRYKIYFSDLNLGAKVSLPAFSQTSSNKKDEFQIYAYNGGLFKEDDELNALKIDDALLFKHTEKLSNYDFASEVDVNILGHIFENSLNDVDELAKSLANTIDDSSPSGRLGGASKRKKDGVFYTPKYITKYIVDNTVGKLCHDKKVEFKINEEDYITDKKRNKTTIQNLAAKLTEYRNWLLQITICDPACGSGAFLNQALDFLINEHKYIDELQAKLFGDALILSDVEQSILENNIFGVDINEESVEIAKLSLWLRTAQPNRKLNDLNSNIKCGNSLIDDVEVAGDKAFNWEQQFSKIFDKGGFDVIIGNPPYSYRNTISNDEKKFFENNYISYEGNFDLYKFFIEKGLVLSKTQGLFSFITSSSFLIQTSFKKLRKLMLTNNDLIELIPLSPSVFEDATVDTAIFIIKKESNSSFIKIGNPKNSFDILKKDFRIINKTRFSENKDFIFDCNLSDDAFNFLSKLEETYSKMEDCFDLGVGINTGYIKDELVSKSQINEKYHPMVPGTGISRYGKCISEEWIMYDKDFVKSKGDRGRALPLEKYFTSDKILVVRTRNLSMKRRIVATFDNEKKYNLNRLSNIIAQGNNSLLGLLAVLNSSFYNWLFSTKYLDYEIKPVYLKKCPIPNINDENLIDKSKLILMLNKELTELEDKFIRSLQRKFTLSSLSKKLQEFYSISYSDFIKELSKKKIKLSLSDEAEWEEYFNTESKKALELKSKIDATDKEIDQMVYKLYDLTEEEIKIVESA